jgi:hypothetical protein
VKELCATLHKHDDSSKGWFELAVKAIKGAVIGRYGGDSTLTFIVFGYEDEACYVLRLTMQNHEKFYTVSALTTIKSKLLTIHVSTKLRDMDLLKGKAQDVIVRLLTELRETASAVVAVNQ